MTSTLGRQTSPCAEAHTKGLFESRRGGYGEIGPQWTDGRTILRLEVMIHRPSAVLAYGGQLDPSGSSLASCPDLHPELSRRTQVFVGARATGRPLPQGQRRRHRI